jgi:hypothetical protein
MNQISGQTQRFHQKASGNQVALNFHTKLRSPVNNDIWKVLKSTLDSLTVVVFARLKYLLPV